MLPGYEFHRDGLPVDDDINASTAGHQGKKKRTSTGIIKTHVFICLSIPSLPPVIGELLDI